MRERRLPVFALGALAVCGGCGVGAKTPPSIVFTEVPVAAAGGAEILGKIGGRVAGAGEKQRIVLMARSGTWYLQPFSNHPYTAVETGGTFRNSTHMGEEYAALLVDPGYIPIATSDTLPAIGGGVVAVAVVKGRVTGASTPPVVKQVRFSGYEWEVRQTPGDSGGVRHSNSAENVTVDAEGWLHLRIAKRGGTWTCAELSLPRSLGYGTYSFVLRPLPHLEPGAVLGLFTWDDSEGGQNHREIDVELSQWGDPGSKNAQFVVQPFYVPANVFRFAAPVAPASGKLTHSFHWTPGRVSFETSRRLPGTAARQVVAQHVFTSGIPSPAGESVHINLYLYGKSRTPQREGFEVVLEKFEFLP